MPPTRLDLVTEIKGVFYIIPRGMSNKWRGIHLSTHGEIATIYLQAIGLQFWFVGEVHHFVLTTHDVYYSPATIFA